MATPEARTDTTSVLVAALDAAQTPVEKMDAFQDYSRERCVELNSDGATWDCPDDSTEATATPETIERHQERTAAALAERTIRRC